MVVECRSLASSLRLALMQGASVSQPLSFKMLSAIPSGEVSVAVLRDLPRASILRAQSQGARPRGRMRQVLFSRRRSRRAPSCVCFHASPRAPPFPTSLVTETFCLCSLLCLLASSCLTTALSCRSGTTRSPAQAAVARCRRHEDTHSDSASALPTYLPQKSAITSTII